MAQIPHNYKNKKYKSCILSFLRSRFSLSRIIWSCHYGYQTRSILTLELSKLSTIYLYNIYLMQWSSRILIVTTRCSHSLVVSFDKFYLIKYTLVVLLASIVSKSNMLKLKIKTYSEKMQSSFFGPENHKKIEKKLKFTTNFLNIEFFAS